MLKKPDVFNYRKFVEAIEEVERLKKLVANLEIKCRILEEYKGKYEALASHEFLVDGENAMEHAQVNCEDKRFINRLENYLLDNRIEVEEEGAE